MDADQTSHALLAHFDRPKTIDCPDFEWVEDVDETAGCFAAEEVEELTQVRRGLAGAQPQPPATDHGGRGVLGSQPPSVAQTRGVGWVLQWAAVAAVLGFAASVLVEFAYLVSAEHALNVAARAGAVEATLPRATVQSITAVVERRLAGYPELSGQLQLNLVQNGMPVGERFRGGRRPDFDHALGADVVGRAWLVA